MAPRLDVYAAPRLEFRVVVDLGRGTRVSTTDDGEAQTSPPKAAASETRDHEARRVLVGVQRRAVGEEDEDEAVARGAREALEDRVGRQGHEEAPDARVRGERVGRVPPDVGRGDREPVAASAAPAPAEARADAMSGGMMDAKIDGTPFGVLMQQAVKLKTHVHKVDRVKFDRWPKFYQNTAFIKDDQKAERAIEDFDARMAVAQRYKAAADAHLRGGDPMQAGMHYEWAAGLFRWATTLDDNWRKKSLDDEDILEESYDGDTPARREAIDAFKLACYLNIARAYFKQREPSSSGDDPRRARAETLLVAATAAAAARDDLDDAACERLMDDLGKRKKQVRSLLAELRRLRQLGKAQDKAYGGMFDRGEVYDGDETARRRLADAEDAKAPRRPLKPLAPGDGTFSSTPGPEAELAAAEKVLADYERRGKSKEAAELRKGLGEAKAKLQQARSEARRPWTSASRRRPCGTTRRRAASTSTTRPSSTCSRSSSASSETATPEGRERRDVREAAKAKASAMSMRDLIRSLKALGVPHGHCDTKGELKDLYVLACVDVDEAKAADAGARARAPPAAEARQRRPRRPQPRLDADEPDFAARDWTDEF
ncbi:peptidyl-prolyl cis-trans isomerase [Aureococcus anophagefferens]|nr:peptidyl-prolyl cis-trans isomerase [Aureococcus anophagefferens]